MSQGRTRRSGGGRGVRKKSNAKSEEETRQRESERETAGEKATEVMV